MSDSSNPKPSTNVAQLSKSPTKADLTRPISSYIQGEKFRGEALIDYMIYQGDHFIVFLDEDGFVWYDWDDKFRGPPEGFDRVRNRVGVFESIDTSHLTLDQRMSFGRLRGDALVCALNERNVAAANESLDKAQEYITARNQEAARYWYVMSSFGATAGVMLAWVLVAGFLRDTLDSALIDCLFGAFAGGLGAFLSILLRIGKATLDSSAGMKMHIIEGLSRIGVGVIGGVLVTITYQLDLVFTSLKTSGASRDLVTVLIGLVSGASERLVPSLIQRVEIGELKEKGPDAKEPETKGPMRSAPRTAARHAKKKKRP